MEKLFIYELEDGNAGFYSDGNYGYEPIKRGVSIIVGGKELVDMRKLPFDKLEIKIKKMLDNIFS